LADNTDEQLSFTVEGLHAKNTTKKHTQNPPTHTHTSKQKNSRMRLKHEYSVNKNKSAFTVSEL